jgi:hypothetical protein
MSPAGLAIRNDHVHEDQKKFTKEEEHINKAVK